MKKTRTIKTNNNVEFIVLLLIIFFLFVGLVLAYEDKIDELEDKINQLEISCDNN